MNYIRNGVWKIAHALTGMGRVRHELSAFESADGTNRKKEMELRLRAQLNYFRRFDGAPPEWKVVAASKNDDFWRAWREVPILTKADLRNRFHPSLILDRCPGGKVSRSGGSTGEPTSFVHDPNFRALTRNLRAHSRRHMGWRPGVPIVALWGSERDIGKQQSGWREWLNFLQGIHLVGGYSPTDEMVDKFVALILREGPCAVYGFTSLLDFAARSVMARNISIPPGKVTVAWNGGEGVTPEQSSRFQTAFGVPILNTYGGRELSVMATQSKFGEPLKVWRPFLFVEVVNDRNEPCAPGEIGRLLWTSTINRGTPFVRYEIGDLGFYEAGDEDAAGIFQLRRVVGRTGDPLKLPSGRIIQSLYWNHLLKDYDSHVEQFQVRYSASRIHLLLNGRKSDEAISQKVQKQIEAFIEDANCPVEVTWVSSIPRTAEGKLRQVVQG